MVHMKTSKRKPTTEKVHPSEKEDARLINLILADLSPTRQKQLRPFDLRGWGYILDASRKKFVRSSYDLWPVLEEDTRREVSFSFLLDRTDNMGVILPHPYCHFVGGEL
jgi:hypothetical protein